MTFDSGIIVLVFSGGLVALFRGVNVDRFDDTESIPVVAWNTPHIIFIDICIFNYHIWVFTLIFLSKIILCIKKMCQYYYFTGDFLCHASLSTQRRLCKKCYQSVNENIHAYEQDISIDNIKHTFVF